MTACKAGRSLKGSRKPTGDTATPAASLDFKICKKNA